MSTEVASLLSTLGWWEVAEYAACAVVFIGVLGETIASRFKDENRNKKRLERLSAIVLLVGLAGELVGLISASKLTGKIIATLKENAIVAEQNAGNAQQKPIWQGHSLKQA
jgi:hypothetical protein